MFVQIKALVTQLEESQRQMNDALAVCKTAIEANDPSQASYFSLKIEPDFREAKTALEDKPVRIRSAFKFLLLIWKIVWTNLHTELHQLPIDRNHLAIHSMRKRTVLAMERTMNSEQPNSLPHSMIHKLVEVSVALMMDSAPVFPPNQAIHLRPIQRHKIRLAIPRVEVQFHKMWVTMTICRKNRKLSNRFQYLISNSSQTKMTLEAIHLPYYMHRHQLHKSPVQVNSATVWLSIDEIISFYWCNFDR